MIKTIAKLLISLITMPVQAIWLSWYLAVPFWSALVAIAIWNGIFLLFMVPLAVAVLLITVEE